ncbi:hypothetical protein M378DRAFT_168670, partial [Amanita muscaria Koide BX008]
MCIITLTVSFVFFGYLLPFFFLFHSLYLVWVVFSTEHSFASALEHIGVIQDDVDILHPPGHFDLLREYSTFGLQDDGSQGNDNDTRSDHDISLIDDSVLSTDSETTTCDIPIIVNIDSNQGDSNYLSILSATRLVSAKPVSDLAEKVPHIDPDSSVIDKPLPESPTDPAATMGIMDSYCNQQFSSLRSAPDSLSTLHSKDSDDGLELTPEEEEILESVLCIQPPYTLPGFARLPEDPHSLDHVPRFSRHNLDATVVFPVRKSTRPGPTSLPNAQRISMTISK